MHKARLPRSEGSAVVVPITPTHCSVSAHSLCSCALCCEVQQTAQTLCPHTQAGSMHPSTDTWIAVHGNGTSCGMHQQPIRVPPQLCSHAPHTPGAGAQLSCHTTAPAHAQVALLAVRGCWYDTRGGDIRSNTCLTAWKLPPAAWLFMFAHCSQSRPLPTAHSPGIQRGR